MSKHLCPRTLARPPYGRQPKYSFRFASLCLNAPGLRVIRTFSLRESQGMDRSAVSGRSGSTNASMGQSQQNSKLSGTRMVEYTTGVHVPLYIWMDPYADFE